MILSLKSAERLLHAACTACDIDPAIVTAPMTRRGGPMRGFRYAEQPPRTAQLVTIVLLREAGFPVKTIASVLRRDHSSVSHALSEMARELPVIVTMTLEDTRELLRQDGLVRT